MHGATRLLPCQHLVIRRNVRAIRLEAARSTNERPRVLVDNHIFRDGASGGSERRLVIQVVRHGEALRVLVQRIRVKVVHGQGDVGARRQNDRLIDRSVAARVVRLTIVVAAVCLRIHRGAVARALVVEALDHLTRRQRAVRALLAALLLCARAQHGHAQVDVLVAGEIDLCKVSDNCVEA